MFSQSDHDTSKTLTGKPDAAQSKSDTIKRLQEAEDELKELRKGMSSLESQFSISAQQLQFVRAFHAHAKSTKDKSSKVAKAKFPKVQHFPNAASMSFKKFTKGCQKVMDAKLEVRRERWALGLGREPALKRSPLKQVETVGLENDGGSSSKSKECKE